MTQSRNQRTAIVKRKLYEEVQNQAQYNPQKILHEAAGVAGWITGINAAQCESSLCSLLSQLKHLEEKIQEVDMKVVSIASTVDAQLNWLSEKLVSFSFNSFQGLELV
eukprot:9981693-Karenia_brevis.AAC.1